MLLGLLIVTGCSGSGAVDRAGLSLSAIPPDSDLRKPCDHPSPDVGKTYRKLTGEYSVALDECDGKRAGAVAFSDNVKQRFDRRVER
jgi:hypothetical protein